MIIKQFLRLFKRYVGVNFLCFFVIYKPMRFTLPMTFLSGDDGEVKRLDYASTSAICLIGCILLNRSGRSLFLGFREAHGYVL